VTDDQQQQSGQQQQSDTGDETTALEGDYSVTDLPDGATPDPLGDASLTARERAGASGDEQ
jgi:hypothetical protein